MTNKTLLCNWPQSTQNKRNKKWILKTFQTQELYNKIQRTKSRGGGELGIFVIIHKAHKLKLMKYDH